MGGYDAGGCDGCSGENPTRQRHFWQIGEKCVGGYDAAKLAAKGALLLTTYTPDAHLWRVGGSLLGESGPECSSPYEIKIPILVEHACKWCALHRALVSYDPWAFEYVFHKHGELAEHNAENVRSSLWWSDLTEDTVNDVIEDLGVMSEARWGRHFDSPRLPRMTAKTR